jgi:hypothetical protein
VHRLPVSTFWRIVIALALLVLLIAIFVMVGFDSGDSGVGQIH